MAIKRTVAILLAALMLLAALPARAATMEDEPSSTAIAFDVLLTRPLGLAATVVGAAVFLVGLPFTIPTRSVGLSADKLVADPLRFTFRRPVGEMDYFDDFEKKRAPASSYE